MADYTAEFDADLPDPTPEQRAELERLIVAAIRGDGREVVPWARIQRQLPEGLREFASSVVTAMWLDGAVWLASVHGRWMVAEGDAADLTRAEHDRHHGCARPPLAV
ncbi:hypothetical protein [Mycolicibacter arupensis]|jgi:hypothetical protein|uniref:Uncharacterized protein n=1 Tax=Mycolicibacter arupensis TaxID=342002 RepID=A0A5C7Y620_9MYCO|nr:hypothetical protein [Mycolicibacter arupensis]TXI56888.1 MAG: hypothetical protein E6Q54_09320 [Mycolicibacter arupensis]